MTTEAPVLKEEAPKKTRAKAAAKPKTPAVPKRITSANRKPLRPNLGKGHVVIAG